MLNNIDRDRERDEVAKVTRWRLRDIYHVDYHVGHDVDPGSCTECDRIIDLVLFVLQEEIRRNAILRQSREETHDLFVRALGRAKGLEHELNRVMNLISPEERELILGS